VLLQRDAEGLLMHGGADRGFALLLDAAHAQLLVPFRIGDGLLQAVVDPIVRVAEVAVGLHHPPCQARRLGRLANALETHLRQPLLEGLRLLGGDRLNDAEHRLDARAVGSVTLAIGGRQFQFVTICHDLVCTFLQEPLLELAPIGARILRLRLNERPDGVHDRVEWLAVVDDPPDRVTVELEQRHVPSLSVLAS
jgi:hypothetical protein